MRPLAGWSHRSGGTVVAIVFTLAIAGLTGVVALRWAAWTRFELVQDRWDRTLGTQDELIRRHPPREANESAKELERLTAPLGIDIAPRSLSDRARPGDDAASRFAHVRTELRGYLTRHLTRQQREIDPPSRTVADYFREQEHALDDLRTHLERGGTPRWELDIEDGPGAVLPNLMGHIHLQSVLLADALVRERRGDSAGAIADLEASWRLNRALRGEPVLITQLVAVAVTRMQAGAMRHIEDLPGSWAGRLFEHDLRASLQNALALEGWALTRLDDPVELDRLAGEWELLGVRVPAAPRRMTYSLAQPYVRFCLADLGEESLRRLELLSRQPTLCDDGHGSRDAALAVSVPRWNLFGDLVLANLPGAVDRLRRLEIDLELTAKLLHLRAIRRTTGAWPRPGPEIERSVACPRDRWIYDVAPDGSATLTFGRDIDWSGAIGPVLPTRFRLDPRVAHGAPHGPA